MESNSDSDSELNDFKTKPQRTPTGLPEKTRRKYQQSYEQFMKWKEEQNVKFITKEIMMNYFNDMATKFKSSTLWSQYSMLRQNLYVHNNIDISQFIELKLWLKKQNANYKPNKAKVFTLEQIQSFLDKAPDNIYLAVKVALVLGITGRCRRQELHQMKVDNFIEFPGSVLVTIPDIKTRVTRNFTVTGQYFEIYKKYANLRPNNCDSSFFLNYSMGKCTAQRIGINKFGAMGQQIAKFLGLPDANLYTGNCFWRSSGMETSMGSSSGLDFGIVTANQSGIVIRIQPEQLTNNPPEETVLQPKQILNGTCNTKNPDLTLDKDEVPEDPSDTEDEVLYSNLTKSQLIRKICILKKEKQQLSENNSRLLQLLAVHQGLHKSENKVDQLLRKLGLLDDGINQIVENQSMASPQSQNSSNLDNLENNGEDYNLELVKEEIDDQDFVEVKHELVDDHDIKTQIS